MKKSSRGDLISFKEMGTNMAFIYDAGGSIIREINKIWYDYPYLLYRLPQIDGKDYYYEVEFYNDTVYNYYAPHFMAFEYIEPEFDLTCDKDIIVYGEKTDCQLKVTSVYPITQLNFSLSNPNLKVSDVEFIDGVTNKGNNEKFELTIDNDDIEGSKGLVLMAFEVTGIKDETYLDAVTLSEILYTDTIVSAEYNNLQSDLNILSSKKVDNPNTGTKVLFIVCPLGLLLVALVVNIVMKKRTTYL